VIKIKPRGLSAKNQGLRRKKNWLQVDSQKFEGLFNKISKRRGIRRSRPSDYRSTREIKSTNERGRRCERALTSGPGRSAAQARAG
jgi:hypothetical protein